MDARKPGVWRLASDKLRRRRELGVPSVEELASGEVGRILLELARDQGLSAESTVKFQRQSIQQIRKFWPSRPYKEGARN